MRVPERTTCLLAVLAACLVLSACSHGSVVGAETSRTPTPFPASQRESLALPFVIEPASTAMPRTPTVAPTPSPVAPPSPPLTPEDEWRLTSTRIISVRSSSEGLTFWASEPLHQERHTLLAAIPGDIRAWNVNLSPDRSQVALLVTGSGTHFHRGELLIADLRSGAVRLLASTVALGRYLNYPIWSPDGRFVAVLRQSQWQLPYDQQIVIVDVQSGRETVLIEAHIADMSAEAVLQVYPLVWSPDSTALYIQQGMVGAVELLRVDRGAGRVDWRGSITKEGLPRCYFSSPDGARLLCMNSSADLRSYTLTLFPVADEAAPTTLLTVDGERFSDPLWSPDGQRLALTARAERAPRAVPLVIEVQGGRVVSVSLDQNEMGDAVWYPVAWAPAGSWLLIASPETGTRYQLVNTARSISMPLLLPEANTVVGWVERTALSER